jgi:hypothetical protein
MMPHSLTSSANHLNQGEPGWTTDKIRQMFFVLDVTLVEAMKSFGNFPFINKNSNNNKKRKGKVNQIAVKYYVRILSVRLLIAIR